MARFGFTMSEKNSRGCNVATPGRPGYLCTYLFKYTRPEEKYAEIDFVSLPLCRMIFSDRNELALIDGFR